MCEAAGISLEQYEQAQKKVDERQDEFNKMERKVKSCKKRTKPLIKAITGLRTRLKNNQAKVAKLEKGGFRAAAAADQLDFDSSANGSEDEETDSGGESDSDGEYAPGEKRKGGKERKPSGSQSKRRRQSVSSSESGLELFMTSDDDDSDNSSEEEQQVVVAAKGPNPKTLPELQAQAAELHEAIHEQNAIINTLKSDLRYGKCNAMSVPCATPLLVTLLVQSWLHHHPTLL